MKSVSIRGMETRLLKGSLNQLGWYATSINLFDPKHEYRISNDQIMTEEKFSNIIHNKLNIAGSMHAAKWELFGLMKWRGKVRERILRGGQNWDEVTPTGAEMEMWRLLLDTSQARHPPQSDKMITEKAKCVTVINLRVDEDHA